MEENQIKGIPIVKKPSHLWDNCDFDNFGMATMAASLPSQPLNLNPFPEMSTHLVPSSACITGDIEQNHRMNPTKSRLLSVEKLCHSTPGSRSHSPAPPRKSYEQSHENNDSQLLLQEDLNWRPNEYDQVIITAYNTDDTFKTVTVNHRMSACDTCHLLVLKNHAIDDKNWVLVEHLAKFNIERALEDHEIVSGVHKGWQADWEINRFYFRKDFKKYDFFQNPANYFPTLVTSLSQDILSVGDNFERKKTLLIQNLMVCGDSRVPDIEGILHIKDSGKKSFKKLFCVLRGSGLYYSTKGTSMDPKHLTLFSTLSDVNIYTCSSNAKKYYHAPSEFCIVLKSTEKEAHDAKEMKCLCTDDEKAKILWLGGLRLLKYGKKLRENYITMVRRLDKLKSLENDSFISKQGVLNPQERVAMDFTGHQGRVIADPNEALGVAIAEGNIWRKKASNRVAINSPKASRSPPRLGTSPGYNELDNSPPGNRAGFMSMYMSQGHGLSSGIHMTQPWFHSGLTREETQNLIVQHGLVDGAFLIRESHRIPDVFVLSMSHNQKVKHYQIIPVDFESSTFYSMDDGVTKFSDLLQLVEFYQVNTGGLPCHLTNHITKLV